MKVEVLSKNMQIPFKFENPNTLDINPLKKTQSNLSIRLFICHVTEQTKNVFYTILTSHAKS